MLAARRRSATAENDAAPRSRKRRWRTPRMLVNLALILAFLWCGYWFVAYTLAHSVVEDANAAETTLAGPILSCLQRAFGGFPLQLTVQCQGASASTDDVRASIGHVAAAAPLYRPGQVVADVAGPFHLEAPGFVVNAAWNQADATVDAGLIGPLAAKAAFSALDLSVEEIPGVPMWSAQATQWGTEIRPAPDVDEAIRLVLSAEDLVVTLGADTFPQLSGLATVTLLESGERLTRNPVDIFRTWLGAGGQMMVDHAFLTSGAVQADIEGPVKLELDGTISGDLNVRYTGEEDLPLLVEAVFPWAAAEADVVAEAIVAVSRPVDIRGTQGLEVRLRIDHGVIKYGLFPIVTIPSMGSLAHLLL